MQDLALLVIKNHLPIQFVERIWFETSCNEFISRNCVYIKKIVFTKSFALFGGENKMIVLPT
jgi:hypothetical protein